MDAAAQALWVQREFGVHQGAVPLLAALNCTALTTTASTYACACCKLCCSRSKLSASPSMSPGSLSCSTCAQQGGWAGRSSSGSASQAAPVAGPTPCGLLALGPAARAATPSPANKACLMAMHLQLAAQRFHMQSGMPHKVHAEHGCAHVLCSHLQLAAQHVHADALHIRAAHLALHLQAQAGQQRLKRAAAAAAASQLPSPRRRRTARAVRPSAVQLPAAACWLCKHSAQKVHAS